MAFPSGVDSLCPDATSHGPQCSTHSRETAACSAGVSLDLSFPHVIIAHTPRSPASWSRNSASIPTGSSSFPSDSTKRSGYGPFDRRRAPTTRTATARPNRDLLWKSGAVQGVDLLAEMGMIHTADARLVITGWCPIPLRAANPRRHRPLNRGSGRWSGAKVCAQRGRRGVVRACDLVVMPYRNIYQSGVVFLWPALWGSDRATRWVPWRYIDGTPASSPQPT